MVFSPSILSAVHDAVRHHADLEKAKEVAVQTILALPEYAENEAALVRLGIYKLVWDVRHNRNTALKEGKLFPAPSPQEETTLLNGRAPKKPHSSLPPIDTLGCRAVQDIYAEYYNFRIAGQRLGSLRGSDLGPIIESLTAMRDGVDRDIQFLQLVEKNVKSEQRVDDLPGKKLQSLFNRVYGKKREAAAVA